MQSFINPINNDSIQYIFKYIPEDELLKNFTLVSKDLNKAVRKNKSCSIIQATLNIVQRALTGQINSSEMSDYSIRCTANANCFYMDYSKGDKIFRGDMSFPLKRDPLQEKAFIPFNVYEDTTFLEKASNLYHISRPILTYSKVFLFNQEISSEEKEEISAKLSEIYIKNHLTDISVRYQVKEGKNRIENRIDFVSFNPFFKKIWVDEQTIKKVQAFFSEHKIVIENKKI